MEHGFATATELEVRELLLMLPYLPASGLNLLAQWINISDDPLACKPVTAERMIRLLQDRINDGH